MEESDPYNTHLMILGGKQRGTGLAYCAEIWEISQKALIAGEHTKVIAMYLKHGWRIGSKD